MAAEGLKRTGFRVLGFVEGKRFTPDFHVTVPVLGQRKIVPPAQLLEYLRRFLPIPPLIVPLGRVYLGYAARGAVFAVESTLDVDFRLPYQVVGRGRVVIPYLHDHRAIARENCLYLEEPEEITKDILTYQQFHISYRVDGNKGRKC